jgi:hypothetical protein
MQILDKAENLKLADAPTYFAPSVAMANKKVL